MISLISLIYFICMIISGSTHVAADGIISLFFMADHLSFFNGM